MLVDLPGYGYARVSHESVLRWAERLEKYLLTRSQLQRLFILIDSRVGVKDSDLELMDFCDKNGVLYQIVYTKKDKKIREKSQVEISHDNHGAMVQDILMTSAEKKTGIDGIRKIIGIK